MLRFLCIAVCASGLCAQSSARGEEWLSQNYHLAGRRGRGPLSSDPVMAQLQEVQNTVLAILRKANFAGSPTAVSRPPAPRGRLG